MSPSINPILTEIDRAHATLSPPAQRAVQMGMAGLPVPVQEAAQQPATLAAPPVARGGLEPAQAGPLVRPMQSQAPLSQDPEFAAASSEHNRLTNPTLETSKSGAEQIHNPFLRTLARVGDVVGSGIFPRFAAAIPGTQIHHNVLVHQNERNLAGMEQRANEETNRQHLGAETDELPARAAHEQAQADALRNPPEKQGDPTKTIETADGIMQFNPQSGKYDIPIGEAPGKNAMQHVVTADGSVVALEHDPKTGTVNAHVVYKGDPKVETDLADLQVGGKPHKVIVNKQTGETIRDLGESGIKPPTVNVNAGNTALDHEIGQYGKPWQTMTTGVSSQLDKILDAEKMVAGGAIQQALGIPKVLTALVSGQGSGVRITQAELNSIAKARGIQGDIEGWFNKLSGKGQLTGEQKQQLGGILEDVKARILQKKSIADGAIDEMQNGRSREDILGADKKARKSLDDFERSGATSPNNSAPLVGTINGKKMQYKGSGDTADIRNWAEVKQ